LIVATEQDGSV